MDRDGFGCEELTHVRLRILKFSSSDRWNIALVLYKLVESLEAKDVLPSVNQTQAGEKGGKMPFSSLVTLTFDLDTQTGPSEGPNTSSL